MNYRQDRYGNNLSILGYGCMRFSRTGGKIDIDKAEQEIMAAFRGGVNYYDTAYVYSGSEAALGEILERNREITASDLEETDNAGGNRKNTESGEREEVIYKKDADGNETPYVVQRKLPEVTGVVVIAEGAGNTKVKENIIGAVSVLFNLNEHRIKVIRMKS